MPTSQTTVTTVRAGLARSYEEGRLKTSMGSVTRHWTGSLRPFRRPIWWLASVLVVSAFGVSSAAAADPSPNTHIDSMFKTSNTNWNCPDGGSNQGAGFCRTDNSGMTWHVESSLVGTIGHSSIAQQLNNEFAPTDLIVTFTINPSYNGGSETDIIYQQGAVSGAAGVAWCNDAVTSTKCDQHYARFRADNFGGGLACHESGHAIGLTHGAEASPTVPNNYQFFYCMRLPASAGLGPDGGVIVSQIDATY